jgi:chromosome segregation ATPase
MLGAFKTAATGAVSSRSNAQSPLILTLQIDAMGGSNQASDSQDSPRTCRNLSVDELRHGVHIQPRARGELMTKSRTKGKTPKDSQQHREEAVIPAHIAAEVVPALEAELTQREEELDQLTYEHGELREIYGELRDIYGELKDKYGELREKHREVKRDAESDAKRLTDCDKNLTFLHGVFSDLVTKHLDPYAKRNGLNIDIGDWNTSDIDKAVKKMARDANEASTLQDQVRILQKELITKVDKVKVATD